MRNVKKSSIITVNYNSSYRLLKLLSSLKKVEGLFDEIIVIDNNSKKGQRKLISNLNNIKLVFNKINVGFAKAVNQGLSVCKNEIALVINPDCEFMDNSPKKTFELILNNKNIAAIGGKLVDPVSNDTKFSATTKPGFFTALFEFTNLKKLFPDNPWTKTFWVEKHNISQRPLLVHSLCGAYMFIRNYNFCRFDERFFLYLEDLDLGDIILKNHKEIWFDPRSHIKHTGGSSSNSKYKIVLSHWYTSRKIFFSKHLPSYQSAILSTIFSIEEILLRIYHKITSTQYE